MKIKKNDYINIYNYWINKKGNSFINYYDYIKNKKYNVLKIPIYE